jgi:hypothetical protein
MRNEKKLYWANVCILLRKEKDEMEAATVRWLARSGNYYRMIPLGDTEDVKIHERLMLDKESGGLGFDVLVSSRFDVFCSREYLLGAKESLARLGGAFPVRPEVKRIGVEDPWGIFSPLAVLPHYIVRNAGVMADTPSPRSLEELLDPRWAGQVVVGNTEMPSGQVLLFTMWYLFGDEGLETCARNWRQKSAPSGVRHGLVKGEFTIGILPGLFTGPSPDGKLQTIKASEGLPVLPSYAAVKAGPEQDDAIRFLGQALIDGPMPGLYRELAFAVVSNPSIPLPDLVSTDDTFIFPDWKWIEGRDMEYFRATIGRLTMI